MKKKIILAILSISILPSLLSAQTESQKSKLGKIGLSYSGFGESDLVRQEDLVGAASYKNEEFYSIGINYLYPIKPWLEFETGIEYSEHSFLVEADSEFDRTDFTTHLSLIDIPMSLRANFLNYFFVNGGFFLELEPKTSDYIDHQAGIGGLFGIGAKYDFDFGGSVYINPYLKLHALLPFAPEDNQQKLYESGLRIGFTYSLDHKK